MSRAQHGPVVWAAVIAAVGMALLPVGRAREDGAQGRLVGQAAPRLDFGEEPGAVADLVNRCDHLPDPARSVLDNFYRWSRNWVCPRTSSSTPRALVVREFPSELPPETMLETLQQLLNESRPAGANP